jgi:hypothetical protein
MKKKKEIIQQMPTSFQLRIRQIRLLLVLVLALWFVFSLQRWNFDFDEASIFHSKDQVAIKKPNPVQSFGLLPTLLLV